MKNMINNEAVTTHLVERMSYLTFSRQALEDELNRVPQSKWPSEQLFLPWQLSIPLAAS